MNPRTFAVCLFLFGSGLCALVYQTVWLREFRLIFGASTAATAAVLGIFMGGLGAILGAMTKTDRWVRRYGPASDAGVAMSETPRVLWSVHPDLRKHSIAVSVSWKPRRR